MQTFLPYPNFYEAAEVLDDKRLWKQILEANQILKTIYGVVKSRSYSNHPAVKMWTSHKHCLEQYRNILCQEWVNRRLFKPPEIIITSKIMNFTKAIHPWWLMKKEISEKLCGSHRASLLYKDYDFYSQFGWKETPENNLYWPI